MSKTNPKQASGPVVNRVADLAIHTDRYAFKGLSRLALDARVNPSSLSRLWRGHSNPSFATAARITAALEREFGFPLDIREVFAEGGNFKTPHVCQLCRCRGCLPERAIDEFGERTPGFENVKPGEWVTSRYPHGIRKGGLL